MHEIKKKKRPVVQLWGHQLHLNVTALAEPSFCFLPIAGLVVCCQGGRRADSSAPEAAAAVSADCSGAGAATQGTHTLKNTQKTHTSVSKGLSSQVTGVLMAGPRLQQNLSEENRERRFAHSTKGH